MHGLQPLPLVIPLSQEDKPEAYPDGPICVYDPHIDLYLEPTAEQAKQYDVVMNVASEVRNPFQQDQAPNSPESGIRIDGGGGIQTAPRRNRPTLQNAHHESSSSAEESTPSTLERGLVDELSNVFWKGESIR